METAWKEKGEEGSNVNLRMGYCAGMKSEPARPATGLESWKPSSNAGKGQAKDRQWGSRTEWGSTHLLSLVRDYRASKSLVGATIRYSNLVRRRRRWAGSKINADQHKDSSIYLHKCAILKPEVDMLPRVPEFYLTHCLLLSPKLWNLYFCKS